MGQPLLKATEEQRHPLFLEIIEELPEWDIASVAEVSGVHFTTLYSWLRGDTLTPITRTLFAVAEAMGYELRWERVEKHHAHLTLVK